MTDALTNEVQHNHARALSAGLRLALSGLFLALNLPVGLSAQALSPSPGLSAEAAFRQGLQSLADKPAEAKELFATSARIWEAGAAADPGRWYDAATAWYCAAESAKSVVDFRRYLQHDYFNQAAWENLDRARRQAGTLEPGGEGPGAWPWAVWLVDAAALLAGSAALAGGLWLLFRRRVLRHLCLGLVLGLGLAGTAALVAWQTRPVMAVVLREVTGRKGDSAAYQAQPAKPWLPGQELRVLGQRDTWVQVQVGPTVSWIPREDLLILEW